MKNSNLDVVHYYLNLDRSSARRAHIEKQLKIHQLKGQRIVAIDGNQLAEDLPSVDRQAYLRKHGRHVRPGEIGCYLSHLKAVEEFLKSEAEHAVILEDDAVLSPSYPEVVAALLSDDLVQRWDMVKLQCLRSQVPWKLTPLTTEAYLGVAALRATGTTAYMVNRYAANRLLERMLPMVVPYDHACDRAVHLGFRVRAAYPYPVTFYNEGESASTIETEISRRGTHLQRMTTQLWRAETEICRVASAIKAVVTS